MKFTADVPTITMSRLKALITASQGGQGQGGSSDHIVTLPQYCGRNLKKRHQPLNSSEHC